MEFDIYKVTLSDAKVEIEKAIRLVVLNDIQARNFCIDHELLLKTNYPQAILKSFRKRDTCSPNVIMRNLLQNQ
jgi:hypothetical protein